MEQIKKKIKNASLKKSFVYAVSCSVAVMIMLSGVTIWLCVSFQSWLMPDPNAVYLTLVATYADGKEVKSVSRLEFGRDIESVPLLQTISEAEDGQTTVEDERDYVNVKYSVEKVERGVDMLTPKRKIAYTCSQAAMIIFPLLYSVAGIFICALWFYKNKLDKPIRILSEGTANIAAQNLEFSMEYDGTDELGQLCASFEKMRQALYENNRAMWRMLEERKSLWASVAHDLRNPIAVIKGYAEHLQLSIVSGKLNNERLMKIASNLRDAAKRMECYTDSIRDISNLEELKIHRVPCALPEFLMEIAEDFTVIAGQRNIELRVTNSVTGCEAMIDRQAYCRILENIFTNALRYAENAIEMDFSLQEHCLITTVSDDGEGFPEKMLSAKEQYIFTADTSEKHMGMGITVSKILCRKHGGELKLANRQPKGAVVTVVVEVM